MKVEDTPYREALRLAGMGITAFPVKPGTKVPAVRGWQRRCHPYPGTTLGRLFDQWPDANLGMRTGYHSQGEFFLVVVDVDPRNGGDESLARLRAEHQFPPWTPTARTPSGGHHLLFGTRRRIGSQIGFRPGIDIKGEGGMILVEPSRIGGKVYVWEIPIDFSGADGVATLPDSLVDLLICDTAQTRTTLESVAARAIVPFRSGDAGMLADQMIERYPITGYGQRHRGQAPVIASLLARGYDVSTTKEVVMLWTEHYYRAGKCRTSAAAAETEIDDAIAYTVANLKIGRLAGPGDHDAAISEIRLTDGQRSLLKFPIAILQERGKSGEGSICMGGTRISRRLCYALCHSRDEEAFVEALVVQATHNQNLGRPDLFTDRQIAEIAKARHGLDWDTRQVRRLKNKYIEEPGKPATVLPLMRLVERGGRRLRERTSWPSRYEPVFLMAFFEPEVAMGEAA